VENPFEMNQNWINIPTALTVPEMSNLNMKWSHTNAGTLAIIWYGESPLKHESKI
jgi:hypothetical protein